MRARHSGLMDGGSRAKYLLAGIGIAAVTATSIAGGVYWAGQRKAEASERLVRAGGLAGACIDHLLDAEDFVETEVTETNEFFARSDHGVPLGGTDYRTDQFAPQVLPASFRELL